MTYVLCILQYSIIESLKKRHFLKRYFYKKVGRHIRDIYIYTQCHLYSACDARIEILHNEILIRCIFSTLLSLALRGEKNQRSDIEMIISIYPYYLRKSPRATRDFLLPRGEKKKIKKKRD